MSDEITELRRELRRTNRKLDIQAKRSKHMEECLGSMDTMTKELRELWVDGVNALKFLRRLKVCVTRTYKFFLLPVGLASLIVMSIRLGDWKDLINLLMGWLE